MNKMKLSPHVQVMMNGFRQLVILQHLKNLIGLARMFYKMKLIRKISIGHYYVVATKTNYWNIPCFIVL